MISQDGAVGRSPGMRDFDGLTLRLSTPDDALALRRLACLDSAVYDGSRVLLAEADDGPLAALALDGGQAFADPFRHTAEVVELLRLRVGQLAAAGREDSRPALSLGRRAGRRLRRYRAPA